jgi:hypothetical protein
VEASRIAIRGAIGRLHSPLPAAETSLSREVGVEVTPFVLKPSTGTKLVRTLERGRAESPLTPTPLPTGERPRWLGVAGSWLWFWFSNMARSERTPPKLARSVLVMAAAMVSDALSCSPSMKRRMCGCRLSRCPVQQWMRLKRAALRGAGARLGRGPAWEKPIDLPRDEMAGREPIARAIDVFSACPCRGRRAERCSGWTMTPVSLRAAAKRSRRTKEFLVLADAACQPT